MEDRAELAWRMSTTTDFSELIRELQEKNHLHLVEETLESSRKQTKKEQLMKNPKIRYVYSDKGRVLHEKHCACTDAIKDEDLVGTEEFVEGMKTCKACRKPSIIAQGIEDPENFEEYIAWYKTVSAGKPILHYMYVKCKMTTKLSCKELIVRCNEDTWKMKAVEGTRKVILYHNNYRRRPDGTRVMGNGFHIQNKNYPERTFHEAINYISSYEYLKEQADLHHMEPRKEERVHQVKADVVEVKEVIVEQSASEKESFMRMVWKNIVKWLRGEK